LDWEDDVSEGSPGRSALESTTTHGSAIEHVVFEIRRLIVGQDHLLERLLVALLARGHVMLEGVPGLAKTATIKALAEAVGGSFGRVQFTPDLLPSDLVGTRVYNVRTGELTTEVGPVFANLLLADEINRAPAKVQSALLEVMQEHQVTIGGQSYAVPEPFLVLATQNPIESDGTYPLPEAQLDRFMFKVLVDYPSYEDEITVVERMIGPKVTLRPRLSIEQLRWLQETVDQVYVDPRVIAYAARLVTASRALREHGLPAFGTAVQFGGSPRASINLVLGARALALVRGREYALPRDVAELFPDVMRHRLILSYEGIADGITPDAVSRALLERFPPPRLELAGARHDRVVA
jgi:MoxR-like ATPase